MPLVSVLSRPRKQLCAGLGAALVALTGAVWVAVGASASPPPPDRVGAPRAVDVQQLPAAGSTASRHVQLWPKARTPTASGAGPAVGAGSARLTLQAGTTGFNGDSYALQNATFGADQRLVPPDNGTAANGEYVTEFLNSSGWFYLRNNGGAGAVKSIDLNRFFVAVADQASFIVSDPRVVWDPSSGHWFASAVGYNSVNNSKEYVATTTGAHPDDPTGAWTVYTVWFDNNGQAGDPCNVSTNKYCFGDQPRLGVTSDKVALFWDDYTTSLNRVVQEEGQLLSKSTLIAGGSLNSSTEQDVANAGWFAVVPAYDSSTADLWAVSNTTDSALTQQFTADGKVHALRFSGTIPGVTTSDVGATPSAPTAGAPNMIAPQPSGAPDLSADDDRITVTAFSGSLLVGAANTQCTINSTASICTRVFEFGISGGTATYSGDANVGAQGESFYYGAPAFDATGDVVLAGTVSSTTIDPAAAIAGATAGSPLTFSAPSVVHPGATTYNSGFEPQDCTSGTGWCRWGDYSSAEPDPCDGSFVWTSGEYANASTAANWGTWIAPVTFGSASSPAACAGAPAVASVSPSSGPAGASVTVTGSNFTGAEHVYFGVLPAASFSVTDSGHLTASAPAGTGTVDVTVVSASGSSLLNTPGDQFTFTPSPSPSPSASPTPSPSPSPLPAPTVSSISPDTAPADGVTQERVTVNGTHFAYPLSASFGALGAVQVASGSAGSFTVTAPASAVGRMVAVGVTTGGGTSAATAAGLLTYTDGGYTMDAYGRLAPFGVNAPPPLPTDGPYWPGWQIARGLAVRPDRGSGYVLDGWGGLHAFGGAPAATGGPYWSGWDIARAVVLDPCDSTASSGYVLDGFGGIHPFGGAAPIPSPAYWSGWDIARAIVMNSCGHGGYVMDGWGGLHPFATGGNAAPAVPSNAPYWPGWNIARSVVLTADGSGYTLDGFGGVHAFGGASSVTNAAYWAGWDIARAIAIVPGLGGGYTLDGWGGVHPFGPAPAASASAYAQGEDIFRSMR